MGALRPYDLRHTFASLLLAEGRTLHYVAAQIGDSVAQTALAGCSTRVSDGT